MLSALLAVLCGVVSVCSVGWLPWWTVAVPGGLVVAFVAVSRFSVKVMRRDLDARYAEICRGSDEATVLISRKDAAGKRAGADRSEPAGRGKSDEKPGLWDPVPITVPTYVSKPLAPRTVRTIDLSGPGVTSSARQSVPVTADAPLEGPVQVEATAEERREDGGAKAASA